jgi:hypothetical protein
MKEIFTFGYERGVKLFYKAEYCGTPQSKGLLWGLSGGWVIALIE